jgi:homocysteine S-methyltransferase
MTDASESSPILLLDGGTGTELDRRDAVVELPLWSARALIDAPALVEEIHADYLEAGSGAIVTNTFRTHQRSLAKAGLADRADELTRQAVEIARSARDRVKPDALVIGSVAPLEDCYHPELAPDRETCKAEHAQMITRLLDAGVDRILLETMGSRREALAAADMARHLAPGKWAISFCTKSQGPPAILQNGTPLVDVLPMLEDAWAVGVNCVAAPGIETQVRLLHTLLPPAVGVAAYGNVGHADAEGNWVCSDAVDAEAYADYVEAWVDAGATVVGGCCGTTPETIRVVAERLAARARGSV